jgi:hypothetical protein
MPPRLRLFFWNCMAAGLTADVWRMEGAGGQCDACSSRRSLNGSASRDSGGHGDGRAVVRSSHVGDGLGQRHVQPDSECAGLERLPPAVVDGVALAAISLALLSQAVSAWMPAAVAEATRTTNLVVMWIAVLLMGSVSLLMNLIHCRGQTYGREWDANAKRREA